MSRGAKPGERRGGRQKGTPNKLSASVKEAILHAFDRVGGVDYLVSQAAENPTAFLTLLGKILPIQAEVTGRDGEQLIPEPDLSKLTDAQLRVIAGIRLATDGS